MLLLLLVLVLLVLLLLLLLLLLVLLRWRCMLLVPLLLGLRRCRLLLRLHGSSSACSWHGAIGWEQRELPLLLGSSWPAVLAASRAPQAPQPQGSGHSIRCLRNSRLGCAQGIAG